MRSGRLRTPIPVAVGGVMLGTVIALLGALAPGLALGASGDGAASGSVTPVVRARGIDESSFQHPAGAKISWRLVAQAGYRFAFIKSTEGSYYVNPYFKADAAAAKAAGLLVAAYHFANPANSSGTVQAEYALSHGGYHADGRTLRLVLDIEPDPYLHKFCYGLGPARMVSWIAAFMREAHRRTGLRPVINTQPAWWNKCTGKTRAFGSDQLWVQDPRAGIRTPKLPSGWTNWAYWQYSITGQVPGITGNTDLNKLSPALLAVASPGDQTTQAGHKVRLQVRSVNMTTGQALSYTAAGLPAGLSISKTTGMITGTLAATPGNSRVTVTVSAVKAASVTLTFTWHVQG
jgi:GH25 family lysozyme M1 (1,4-beta-N-acetylmuramidase)